MSQGAKRQRTDDSSGGSGGGPAIITATEVTDALASTAATVMDSTHRLPDFQAIAENGEDVYRLPEEAEGWVLRHGTSLQASVCVNFSGCGCASFFSLILFYFRFSFH